MASRQYSEFSLNVSMDCDPLHHVMSIQSQISSVASLGTPLRIYRDRSQPFVSLSSTEMMAQDPNPARQAQKSKVVTQDAEFIKFIAETLGDDVYPWVLEDADGEHSYIGKREKGQENSYVFFVNIGCSFMIVPVSKWYRFYAKSFHHQPSSEDPADTRKDTVGETLTRALKRTAADRHSHVDELDYQETFADDEEIGFDEVQLYGDPDDPSAPTAAPRRRHLSQAGERLKRIVSSIDRNAVEVDSDSEKEAEPAATSPAKPPQDPLALSRHVQAQQLPSQKAKRAFGETHSRPRLTEDGVVELLRGGPLKTKDLVVHFKDELKDQENKQALREILKKIAAVTSSSGSPESEKLLVLKDEYSK